jgi:hypothetical protein
VPTKRADLTPEQRIVLDTIFEVFRDNAKWPTFDYVDKRVYDSHGLELRDVLDSLPPDLVIYSRYGQPEETLPLRMAGVACCERQEGVVRTFLRILAWCVEKQQAHNPLLFEKTIAPSVTAKDAVREWKDRGWEVSDLIVERAFELMKVEGLHGGWSFNSNEPLSWSIVVPKELRAYKDVQSLDDYLERREELYRRAQERSPVVQALRRAVEAAPAQIKPIPATDAPQDVTSAGATRVPEVVTRKAELDEDQREALLRMICDVLCPRTWDDISGFLGRFSLKADKYELGRFAYVRSGIQSAEDKTFVAICDELQIDIERWESESLNPWKPARFRLFCSHASDDHKFVGEVSAALEAFAIDGFVAHKDIKPQSEWESVIEYALGTADAMVAFVNDKFAASSYCNQEVGWGLGRGVVCTSIMMRSSPVGFAKRFQGIPHLTDPGAQAKQIFEVLADHRKTSALIAGNLVAKLEESASWEEASAVGSLLPKCKRWSPQTLDGLAEAVKRVKKVGEAWGVADAVEAVYSAAREPIPDSLKQALRLNHENEKRTRRR